MDNVLIERSYIKAVLSEIEGRIDKAYTFYTMYLECCPSKREELKDRYTSILCEWGLLLEQNNRMKDIIKCYKKSLEMFPNNSTMLNNFAAHHLRNEEPLKAMKYLERALEADRNFLPAERNLQNVYSMAVDRWHFPMLNDKSRNHAFYQAITKKVCLGYDTVLDIGTGTGLLSLYAHDAGASEIYACEYSPVMYDIAKQVFCKNRAEEIKLMCKPSTQLKIPEDIPQRVKLIVTEIFDAALFGELVIPTLIDAHNNLLASDGTGIIIPMCATLYIAAVESEYIRFRSSVSFEKANFGPLSFDNILVLPDEDYYDTENLENVTVNYITEPTPILKVNFNDLTELNYFSEDGIKEVVTTACRYDGIVDGLVAWFKLNLDEDIVLDSSQGKSCWQLAVFPAFSQDVKAKNKLVLTAQILDGKLKCSYRLDNEDVNVCSELIYRMPQNIITFLNDEEYMALIIDMAKSKIKEPFETFFDTCPFPLCGLIILKENKACKALYHQTNNEALKHFIEHVIKINNIDGTVHFVSDISEITCKMDNIFVHNFDMKGELMDWGQQSYRQVFSSLLSENGSLLPERIFLMGQLVYSEELPKMVAVSDSNLQRCSLFKLTDSTNTLSDMCNDDEDYECSPSEEEKVSNSGTKNRKYMIAEFINKFKINQVFDLNSSLYNYNALSDVRTLVEIDESKMKEGVINFGKIDTQKNETVPNALICWYKICLGNDKILETRRNRSFMNHMAIVFERELQNKVLQGEDVKIKVEQMYDLVRLNII